jgi:ribose transport system permease protein
MSAPAETGPQVTFMQGVRRAFAGSSAWPIFAALIAVILVSAAISASQGENFFTVANLRDMLVRSVALGIVAAGQTLVIVGGSLDLSVAYLISVATIVAATVMAGNPDMIVFGVLAVLAVGAFVGLVNGLIITKLRVNAFIATLGTALIMRGLLDANFEGASGEVPREFGFLGYGGIGPVPFSVILLLAVFALVWFLLRSTRFGHRLYAVGGSEETARLSGVRTHRVIIGAHVLCSLAAVLTGLFIASRLRAGDPLVGPVGGYDLESIAAVVVGGTALAGGRGGVIGTLGGVFILAVLDNLFNTLEVNAFLKDVIRGIIIIAAVALYALRRRGGAERKGEAA